MPTSVNYKRVFAISRGFIFAKLGDRENKVSIISDQSRILQYKSDEMVRLFPS